MQNKTFGVIGAMESEVAQLRDALCNREATELFGLTFFSGVLGKNRVVLVRSGIGKVNAARCAQILIDKFAPDYVINTGVAGGIGENLNVSDIVIGAELVQHDFDVSPLGYVRGNLCEADHRDTPTVFHSDAGLTRAFREAAAAVTDPSRVKIGRIATGDLFVASAEAKREIAETFGAIAAEMEGGAIAQTAFLAGVPFLVLRAISDLADGSSPRAYEEFEQEAADLSAKVMKRLIEG